MRVTLKGFIEVPESELSMIEKELEIHTKLTREEVGCITFAVVQDKDQLTKFSVYEEFESERAFYLHQERARNSNWGKVSGNVKRSYQVCKG